MCGVPWPTAWLSITTPSGLGLANAKQTRTCAEAGGQYKPRDIAA